MLPLAAEELPGDAPRRREHILDGPGRHDVTAVLARTGADVDHPVGGADRLLVVLDDDQRVADVAQRDQRADQLVVVALVQPDRRLVEDVEDAHQLAADLRRKADALRLTAGKRRGAAIDGEVVEPDVVQETEALLDLLDHLPRDRLLALAEPQRVAA